MQDIEEIIPKKNKDGLPGITRIGNTYYLTECSSPQMPDIQFSSFFKSIRHTIENEKNIIIDFKIGAFSTNSQQVLKKLFEILNKDWYKCRPTVNWYYFSADTDMLEYGEMYQEWNQQIKFNFIEIND